MKPAIRIAFLYALLSGLYIVLSDKIALEIARNDSNVLTQWQSVKGLAFVGASAAIIFFLVFYYVRRRDRAERSLEEVRQSFEQLFRRIPLPVLVYDTATLRFLAVNDAAVDEYGFKGDEFLHQTLANLHPEQDLEKLLAHVGRVKPYPYTGQWRHIRRDGTIFDVEIISHPTVFADCQARLTVAVNISNRKMIEQALADAFEARIEAGEAKSKFLATISHEMRTPLNAITGCLDLIGKESDEIRRNEFTAIALRSSDELLAMIGRLIDSAALSTQTVRRERKEIELEKFLRRIVDGFFHSAVRKSIKLDLDPAVSLPSLALLDANRIEETLQILLGNAIKFSNGGTVTLSARLRREDPRAILELAVADEGIGIPETQQTKVFESFFQVDQNFTRRYGGVGMGLFVAKQLCDLIGASLQVESVTGVGSTFRISLPGRIDVEGRFAACGEEFGFGEAALAATPVPAPANVPVVM